jgi:hypothetical protein
MCDIDNFFEYADAQARILQELTKEQIIDIVAEYMREYLDKDDLLAVKQIYLVVTEAIDKEVHDRMEILAFKEI